MAVSTWGGHFFIDTRYMIQDFRSQLQDEGSQKSDALSLTPNFKPEP